MSAVRLGQGERLYVDASVSMRAMVFPVLELLVITGLMWMFIGYVDRIPTYDEFGTPQGFSLSAQARNIVVLVWMVLCALRFFVPLIRVCRSRLIVTSHRIVLRAPGLTNRMETVPIRSVYNATRQGDQVIVNIHGFGPVLLNHMPRAKRITHIINEAAARAHQQPGLVGA